jgi:ribonucleoside-diphosphate reductase alpha chain
VLGLLHPAVGDDLMSIYDLVKFEARLFKYGSGTGTNFSNIRGKQEKLSGGGTSSGLMSFLEVLDRAAGATKSGGTTRRAAKMVCLDMDHPEIVDFIQWKVREKRRRRRRLIAAGYASDFNGEAYHTVSGQNSNNSIRVSDEFMQAVLSGGTWQTRARTSGEVVDTYSAKDVWRMVADAAWGCADPGVQYDSTINKWHTCPNSGRINASNPCSEYMFLDDTACNLASLNLTKFLDENGRFDVDAYRHAVRIFFIAQEILVDFSSYPTQSIAQNSHDYRPLGLGYANLGTLLMLLGLPYDSDEGRALAGSLTAIMCGKAYAVSAEMAATRGRLPRLREEPRPRCCAS